jgi:hypothetical protein
MTRSHHGLRPLAEQSILNTGLCLTDFAALEALLKWHVSDFIEEQSAAIGQRKATDMRIDGAGKGSAFVPEEFAFEKAGRHRSAVHLHQISVSPGAEFVNRPRDDFLAGAGLPGNQDRCIRARNGLDLTED